MSDWLREDELEVLRGVGMTIGAGCKISAKADILGARQVKLGDNVRIDIGAIIMAGGLDAYLEVGSHVHIAARAVLACGGGVEIGDFATIGMNSTIVSASDTFNGDYLIGPEFDPDMIRVVKSKVILEDHAIVTTGCTLLPGAIMRRGSVLGANALLKGEAKALWLHVGTPAKPLHERPGQKLDYLEKKWRERWAAKHSGKPSTAARP